MEEADQKLVKDTLTYAMEHGLPVLVEGVTDTIDPIFEPLLNLRTASVRPKNSMVKIAEGLTSIPQLKVRARPVTDNKTLDRPMVLIILVICINFFISCLHLLMFSYFTDRYNGRARERDC